jgi:hypothetical protein
MSVAASTNSYKTNHYPYTRYEPDTSSHARSDFHFPAADGSVRLYRHGIAQHTINSGYAGLSWIMGIYVSYPGDKVCSHGYMHDCHKIIT